MWAILGNSVCAILVSRVVDSLRGKMKVTLLLLMVTAIACWIWLGLLCLRVVPFSLRKEHSIEKHWFRSQIRRRHISSSSIVPLDHSGKRADVFYGSDLF